MNELIISAPNVCVTIFFQIRFWFTFWFTLVWTLYSLLCCSMNNTNCLQKEANENTYKHSLRTYIEFSTNIVFEFFSLRFQVILYIHSWINSLAIFPILISSTFDWTFFSHLIIFLKYSSHKIIWLWWSLCWPTNWV